MTLQASDWASLGSIVHSCFMRCKWSCDDSDPFLSHFMQVVDGFSFGFKFANGLLIFFIVDAPRLAELAGFVCFGFEIFWGTFVFNCFKVWLIA